MKLLSSASIWCMAISDVASRKKPKVIMARGSTRVISRPTTGIINMMMNPPGDITNPASSAV